MLYLLLGLVFTVAGWVFASTTWTNDNNGREEGEIMLISLSCSTLSFVFFFLSVVPEMSSFSGRVSFIVMVFLAWVLWIAIPLFVQFLFMNKEGEVALKNFLAIFKH